MKTFILKSFQGLQTNENVRELQGKVKSQRFFIYAFQLVLLYVLVFAAVSVFAQAPAIAVKETGKLDFVKETLVFNSGKVYLNWVTKANTEDCIYVVERSIDGNEFEPVGLKEGIGSPLELLYSWVDTKPIVGTVQYRIKQINNEGTLVAEAEARSVTTPESNPLFIDKSSRMVQAK